MECITVITLVQYAEAIIRLNYIGTLRDWLKKQILDISNIDCWISHWNIKIPNMDYTLNAFMMTYLNFPVVSDKICLNNKLLHIIKDNI